MTIYRTPLHKRPIFVFTSFIFALIAILLIFLIGLPTILSTSWGQVRLMNYVNGKIDGTIAVEKVNLSWWKGQSFQGITFEDRKTQILTTIDSLSTQTPLYTLLWNKGDQLDITFSGLNVKFIDKPLQLNEVHGDIHIVTLKEPISITLSGETEEGNQKGSFLIEALLNGFEADNIHKMSAKIENFPIAILDQIFAIKNPGEEPLFRKSLGNTLDATLNQKKSAAGMQVSLKVKTANLFAEMTGEIDQGVFKIQETGIIRWTLLPELTHLPEPLPISIKIDALNIPLGLNAQPYSLNFSFEPVKLHDLLVSASEVKLTLQGDAKAYSGTLFFDRLVVQDKNRQASFHQFNLPWTVDPQKIHVDFESQTQLGNQISRLNGTVDIEQWFKENAPNFEKAIYTAKGNLLGFPVLLAEAFLGKPGLTNFLGSSVDLNLQANMTPSSQVLGVNLQGDQLDARASFVLGERLTLKNQEPAHFQMVLTPERFVALRQLLNGEKNKFTLLEPTQIKAKIEKLDLPLKGKFGECALLAAIFFDKFAVLDHSTNQYLGFENIEGHLNSSQISKEINFNLKAEQKDRQGHGSDLYFLGKVEDAFLSNGRLNTKELSLTFQSQVKHFPAGMLCEIACIEKSRLKVEALLGPLIDGEFQVQLKRMNGPVKGSIKGQNGEAQLDAQINQGILTLRQPFRAEVTASPELGASVLQDVLPILGGMIGANDRLRLTVDPKGFSIPLRNLDFADVQMGQLTLELGQVEFNNQGQFGKIMSLLKANSEDTIRVWFTPIYVSMNEGLIDLQRFDMLAMDRYPLATWGTIDIPGDRVDLVIGLSGKSLQNVLNIPIGDPDYMMQFPLKGSLGNASIDKSKAAAKIAALTAAVAGGPQGLVIGTVLGIASGMLAENKAPQPTTQPLPWDTSPDASQENKKKSPLKLIEKGASHLIQGLFGG